MWSNFIGQDSIFNLYINEKSWEDIKHYKEDYKDVIQKREKERYKFTHRSPQSFCREYVVDYIKRFAAKAQLTHCSLHLSVYILDLFMDNHSISGERMWLVVNICILLAAKLEENNLKTPKIKELNTALKHHPYPISDYKTLEILVLDFFHWNVMFPTAAHYTHYYFQAALCLEDFPYGTKSTMKCFIQEMNYVIRDYLDKIISDVHYMQLYKPSKLAAATISLARHAMGLSSWTLQLVVLTGYLDSEIEDTRNVLLMPLPLHCNDCLYKKY